MLYFDLTEKLPKCIISIWVEWCPNILYCGLTRRPPKVLISLTSDIKVDDGVWCGG